MTNYPPFETPEYQEYLRKEQEKHNASMEVARQFSEKYLTTLKKQLQADLQEFNNQKVKEGIEVQVNYFNKMINNYRDEIDNINKEFRLPVTRNAQRQILIKHIQNIIQWSTWMCLWIFQQNNHPIDYELLEEMETIGNNLIAYAKAKKDE